MCVGSSKWESVTRDTGDVRRATAEGPRGWDFRYHPFFGKGFRYFFPCVSLQFKGA